MSDGKVVDLAARRQSAEPRETQGPEPTYRVVVFAASDMSLVLDYAQANKRTLTSPGVHADGVARALLEVVDLLEPREWR